jgi:SAM-dependent methyltransferase
VVEAAGLCAAAAGGQIQGSIGRISAVSGFRERAPTHLNEQLDESTPRSDKPPNQARSSTLEIMMDTQQHLIADPSNAGQVGAWDGSEGAFWTAQAQRFDETLANCHGPFLEAAAIRDRDHVLDVGCGTGQATRDVARAATKGSALGVDLSSQMIALARRTAIAEGLTNVEFQQADAQIHPFESAAFDVVISRMGSMFFGNTTSAFANLHRALRPKGRLTLLTWQGLTDNEWLTEFRAAIAVGRDLPTPPPNAPSPFALSDPDRVTSILDAAGFANICFQSLLEPMSFGPNTDNAFDFVSGLTGWMLDGLDGPNRDKALEALRTTIAKHTEDHGVTFQSATWIIQARKP